MPFEYLLDTNIVSDLIRNPQGRIAAHIGQVGEDTVCINLVVAGEIHFGVLKRNSERLTTQAAEVLAVLPVAPMEPPTAHHYAEIRKELEAAGKPIGPNDLWIAAHARALGVVLVTDNEGEFERIPGLRVVNWLI